jgi:hypothetical protein
VSLGAEPVYVAARRVLLDALEALSAHLDALILVGAQAIYLRVGSADIAMAPMTTDADLAIDPARLWERPAIEELLQAAGFRSMAAGPGSWALSTVVAGRTLDVPVDLMVPTAAAPPGSGRRSVKLPGHGSHATRQATGLEAALVDHDTIDIVSLEEHDSRTFPLEVAGPTALLVAKLHKVAERVAARRPDRVSPKDAADIYRLMLATPVAEIGRVARVLLADELAREVTSAALEHLVALFGARGRPGVRLAVEALDPAVPAQRVEAVCAAFVREMRIEGL